MSFMDKLDKETIESGKQFIKDIKSGIYHKRVLKNSAEDYPIEAALKSFDHLVKSNESQNLKKMR